MTVGCAGRPRTLVFERAAAFFFHFNKPRSKAEGRVVLSLHVRGVCHPVYGVDIRVPLSSRERRFQPRCVIAGRARTFLFDDAGRVTIS